MKVVPGTGADKGVIMYEGTLNSSLVRVAEVFSRSGMAALRGDHCGAQPPFWGRVTIAGGHLPHTAAGDAGQLMEVEVIDHFVVRRGRWMSLRERRMGWEEGRR